MADGPLTGTFSSAWPVGVTASVPLSAFLAAIDDRLELRDDPVHVRDAEVREAVLGGFAEPFTGRESRVNLAQTEVALAEGEVAMESGEVGRAQTNLRFRRRLLDAASAAEQLCTVEADLKALEIELGVEQQKEADAASEWVTADLEHSRAKSSLDNHQANLSRLQREVTERQNLRGMLEREEKAAVAAVERVQIRLWEDTWHRPHRRAIELIERETQRRGKHISSWWLGEALLSLKEARTHASSQTGGQSSFYEPVPEAVDNSDAFDPDVPNSMMYTTRTRPLRDVLEATSEGDAVLLDRIMRNREKREREINEARGELDSMAADLEKQQEMVESSIETALKKIGARLDQLDLRRGWGARLDIVIARPTGPEEAWGWHVTPRWRRAPSGGYISYREVANSAQVKIFAIQLVLAALLADDSVPGRLLILDELGNSLGDANRKHVLSALHGVAEEQKITILGTCQDSVIYDAAGVCGEILWFRHASASDPYNRPTRAWGFDGEHSRVDLIAPWLREGRDA